MSNLIAVISSKCSVHVQAVDALRSNPDGWWAVSLAPLITQAREFHILHRLKSFPVCSLPSIKHYQAQGLCMLRFTSSSSCRSSEGAAACSGGTACPRLCSMPILAPLRAGLGHSAQLLDSILQPERLKACEESLKPEAIRRMWPREVAEKSFIDYLWSQYDYTQLGAIEVRPSPCTTLRWRAPSSLGSSVKAQTQQQ